jgi:hypothetical protein
MLNRLPVVYDSKEIEYQAFAGFHQTPGEQPEHGAVVQRDDLGLGRTGWLVTFCYICSFSIY